MFLFPFSFLHKLMLLSLVSALAEKEEAIEKRYINAVAKNRQKAKDYFSIGSSGKDAGENARQGEAVDEKKEDKIDGTESSAHINVAAMKIRFSSLSSSVNAVAAEDSSETNPSTSLKRISDAFGQAKKTFPQSSSSQASLKISKLKSKISSKIQITAKNNNHDIEQESITFHVEEE